MAVKTSSIRTRVRCARGERLLARLMVPIALIASLAANSVSAQSGQAVQTPESVPAEPIAEGRTVFEEKHCAECHTVWGRGGASVGPDLGSVTESWKDVMRLAGALWNHLPEMTEAMRARGVERGQFSDQEMARLMTYLFYVKFLGAPGQIEEGRAAFERGQCSRCHQFAGRGGRIAPRLDELKDSVSPFFFARALWNHGVHMAEKMEELKIERPRLEGDDIADLVALIRGDSTRPVELEIQYMRAATPRAGAVLFTQKGCARCHGSDGSGGTGPGLNRAGLAMTASDVGASFWNHAAPMWSKMQEMGLSYPHFSDGEMSDLLAYLAFLQYAGQEGNIAAGEKIFNEMLCAACHGAPGEGSGLAPDLAQAEFTESVVKWTTAMWNHSRAMEEKFKEMHRPWPRFRDDQMRDLVAFVRSRTKDGKETP